jgi:E3 ubiquitin-protein ligase TRIP12
MHKLSAEHPDVLQREGGLAASLMYIDFFDLNTQRTAAATAANICRNVQPEYLGGVAEVAPNLSQLLSSPDQRIVDSACLAYSRLACTRPPKSPPFTCICSI